MEELKGAARVVAQQSDLHNAIMNLPCAPSYFKGCENDAFACGHRDARHAAAELVAAAQAGEVAARPAVADVRAMYEVALTALETLRGCAASYVEDHSKDTYPGAIGLRPQDVATMWAQEIICIDAKAYLDEAIADAADSVIAASRPAAAPVHASELRSESRLTEFKTSEIEKQGYRKVGYVLQKAGGDYCLSAQSAVRWLDQKQYWRLMHEQDGSLFAAPVQHDQSQSQEDMVDLFGTKPNGETVLLGKVQMPDRMKAKDILANYFGRDFDDGDSPESSALAAFDDFFEWKAKQSPRAAIQHVPADDTEGGAA